MKNGSENARERSRDERIKRGRRRSTREREWREGKE